MYSIGEFSRICGLSVKTLRFYHEKDLLLPASVDEDTGYRYYDVGNIETARIVRALRDLEFSVEDIAVILAECGDDDDLIDFLDRHKRELKNKLQRYQDMVKHIDQIIVQEKLTRETMSMKHAFEIEEKELGPQLIAGLRMKGKYSDCGTAFGTIAKEAGRHIAGKPMSLCYDGEYREDDADFEPCFPIRRTFKAKRSNIRELPPIRCVTLIHQGPYDTLGGSYARLLDYMKSNTLEIDLPTREVYLKGPGMIFRGNPKRYLTEIQMPVK